jgi:sensor c-di-GMP phosphodiesterase-like protein
LRNLPLDILKIDKSFVDALATSDDVTKMVVQLGRVLQLQVIAEGIETAEQREHLQRLGCTHAQGFLFAKPMPVDAILDALRAQHGELAA